jgi:elongation factor Ts
MATVTAAMVKHLREKTGAGMMDCKNALNETDGDLEAAVDWLRKKGLSKAAKKSGRVAAEGLVAVAVSGNRGVVVEVNSETDFVARNEEFQALVRAIALVALEKSADVEALKGTHYPGGGTVTDAIANAVATIGENMNLRRAGGLHVPRGVVGHYVHNAVTEGLGKIGSIVALESTGSEDELASLGRQVAMHAAATAPLALDAAGLDPATVARERAILMEKNAGKPAHVLDKIVESGLKTYYKEVCLADQVSVRPEHGGKTIAQVVKEAEGRVGAPIRLAGFVRYALGEGIEKHETDFAAEVAAAVGQKSDDKVPGKG